MRMNISDLNSNDLNLASKAIALLSADAVEKANSGHPGMPMGMSDLALVLCLKYLTVNPESPDWFNRDRFVLSNGHGSMLLYSMLNLMGFDLSIEDIKQFRQWGSKTPGHPESHITKGVEATTGPLAQGISNAVGMAIGEKLSKGKFNTSEQKIIDHKVYVFAGDGCLMEGLSGEACSLAGHLGLGNLIVVYDKNRISIAGSTDLAFSEDVEKRYESYGWHIQEVDGHNFGQIDDALQKAISVEDRPSLISANTVIGKGSPNKANDADSHGSPLGADELELTKKELEWEYSEPFYVPDKVRELFKKRQDELTENFIAWNSTYSEWKESNKELAQELSDRHNYVFSEDLRKNLIDSIPAKDSIATRKISGEILQTAAKSYSGLVGGSADLEPSTLTVVKDSSSISKDSFSGVNIHFGVREHAMGAIMNGLSYYGGFIPFGSTFLCFSDYMKPAIRLAALSKLRGIFIFTHDSIFLGEDGPTHQPVEHINALRLIPNLNVFRPCDGLETAISYEMALKKADGPTAIVLTRQDVEMIERSNDFDPSDIEKGGYVVFESHPGSNPDLTFVASGSEVPLSVNVAKKVGASSRVVSMPCIETYNLQQEEYKEKTIPKNSKKVVVEAGSSFGWTGVVNGNLEDTLVFGVDSFGESAPYNVIKEKFGFTEENIMSKVKEYFKL